MREVATDLLDIVALLLFAAGVGAGSARWLGWWSPAAAGVVVLAGSLLIARAGRPDKAGPGDVG